MKKLFAAALVAAGIIAASSSAHATIFGDILKKHGSARDDIVNPKPTPKPKKTSSGGTSFSYLDHPYFKCMSTALNSVSNSLAKDPRYQAMAKRNCLKLHPLK